MTTDSRAAVEYKVPAAQLRPGDLVNTNPGDQDWQEVLGVYGSGSDTDDADIRALVSELDGRYVVVQLTDVLPVDNGIYFDDGAAMVYGADESSDHPVSEVLSSEDGLRTYLYTKYELVTIRGAGAG
jgi:hypothetical protein